MDLFPVFFYDVRNFVLIKRLHVIPYTRSNNRQAQILTINDLLLTNIF